jgi:mRNA-degrading endonuclease RelE of RelBE toxin-antitoxin system
MSAAKQPIYQVRLRSRRVQRELDALSQADYRRVTSAIQGLATEPRPRGSVQLEEDIFRIRVGRYRVIYSVNYDEHVVEVGGIRRRTEGTYRGIRDIFSD